VCSLEAIQLTSYRYRIKFISALEQDFDNESSQLKWAKKESERAEKERQTRMKELAKKEEMDIALALKQSVESSSEA